MDKRGVSPVVAAVILIAITVLGAAIVATYLGGIRPPKSPIVTLDVGLYRTDNSLKENDWIALHHIGGKDHVIVNQLEILIGTDRFTSENFKAMDPWAALMPGSIFKLHLKQANYFTVGTSYDVVVVHAPTGKRLFDHPVKAIEGVAI